MYLLGMIRTKYPDPGGQRVNITAIITCNRQFENFQDCISTRVVNSQCNEGFKELDVCCSPGK